jgi:hypothetical protein
MRPLAQYEDTMRTGRGVKPNPNSRARAGWQLGPWTSLRAKRPLSYPSRGRGRLDGDLPGTSDFALKGLESILGDALFEIHQCQNFRVVDDRTKIGERLPEWESNIRS